MNADAAIYSLLKADSTVTGLVGHRIYPSEAVPKSAPLPYVTYERTGDYPVQLMGGVADLYTTYYDVDVFAASKLELNSIENAVIAVLRDYSGTAASIAVQWIFIENSSYGGYDEEINTYSHTIEFIVWHEGD